MRRTDKEITDREAIDGIIGGCQVLRLGLAQDDVPYIVPLSFGYDGSAFYFHTALAGRKLEMIGANPRVCFELEQGVTPEAFEDLIEALVLLSGLTFESGGLAVAHSLIRGLTQLPELKGTLHGEQVAYAVQVQLHLEGDEAELHRLRAFARTVGLPTRLSDLGLPASRLRDAAELVAEVTMKAPYMANFPGKTAAADLTRAIHHLETCENN